MIRKYFFIFFLIWLICLVVSRKKYQGEVSILSDVLFQQLMFYWLYLITKQFLWHLEYFCIGMTLSHLPIIFVKHINLKARSLLVLLLLIASIIWFFLYNQFQNPIGLVGGIFTHFGFYLVLLYIFKDKGKTGIII